MKLFFVAQVQTESNSPTIGQHKVVSYNIIAQLARLFPGVTDQRWVLPQDNRGLYIMHVLTISVSFKTSVL